MVRPARWTEIDWSRYESKVSVEGRTINLVDVGSGPVVLLIHGLGGTWQSWLENIPALAAEHRVIAVDLPGFGQSDTLPVDAKFGAYVDALAGMLRLLDVTDVSLVGHSFGGLVSQELAAAHPDLIASATFVSAGGVRLGRVRLWAVMASLTLAKMVLGLPGMARTIAKNGFLRRLLMRGALHDPSSISRELALETVPRINAPGFGDAVRLGSLQLDHTHPEDIQAPCLVLWGRHDPLIPLAAGEELHRRLADSRLVILSAGHCVMFERPAEFNLEVIGFLKSLPHKSGSGTNQTTGPTHGSAHEEVAG